MDSPWVVGTRGLQVSRSSTALVFAFKLSRVLLASLRASEGAISIGWLRRRRHSGQAQALVAGGRLNLAWTGNLQQPPCQGSSAVNESCYTLVYCSYSNVEFCRQLALQQGIGLVRCSSMPGWSRISGQTGHYYPFLQHYYIIITCYNSKNGSVITHLCIIITSLLHTNTPVITSLLPVISVIIEHYYLLLQ